MVFCFVLPVPPAAQEFISFLYSTLHISLLQTWGILVTGRKAQEVICFWSPGDLQGLFFLSLSFQCMEEGKKEAALTDRFSQPRVLLAAVWVWWGLKAKQHNSRGVFLCPFSKYSYKKNSQVKLAERKGKRIAVCTARIAPLLETLTQVCQAPVLSPISLSQII